MAFFEPLPAAQPRKRPRRRKRRQAPYERPNLLIPRYLPSDLVLAVSDQRAVIMHGIACYPTGFAFHLETVNRFEPLIEDESCYGEFPGYPGSRMSEAPDRVLRFGIEYPNGKRATSDQDHFRGHLPGAAKETGPHIEFRGGGGGGGDNSYEVWVWPLPPEGPVTFACEWPAYGIAETTRRIEGKRLRKAAEKAKPVFT